MRMGLLLLREKEKEFWKPVEEHQASLKLQLETC